jgi:cob(I)alamin adenosyltransferase
LPFEKHVKAAREALSFALKEARTKKWNILILDEIWVALNLKLISEEEINAFLADSKDLCQHLIMTGRGCPSGFVERADLVTEMKEVKHPFASGIMAVKNVEF